MTLDNLSDYLAKHVKVPSSKGAELNKNEYQVKNSFIFTGF